LIVLGMFGSVCVPTKHRGNPGLIDVSCSSE
jgi:hypothetical protein